jgi:hypothetical protein
MMAMPYTIWEHPRLSEPLLLYIPDSNYTIVTILGQPVS